MSIRESARRLRRRIGTPGPSGERVAMPPPRKRDWTVP
jgi:hypothetical protein